MSASDTIRVRRFFERGLYFLNQEQFPRRMRQLQRRPTNRP